MKAYNNSYLSKIVRYIQGVPFWVFLMDTFKTIVDRHLKSDTAVTSFYFRDYHNDQKQIFDIRISFDTRGRL